jgi:hypothetical protein
MHEGVTPMACTKFVDCCIGCAIKLWVLGILAICVLLPARACGQDFDERFQLDNIKTFSCAAKVNDGPHNADTRILAHATATFITGEPYGETKRECSNFTKCSTECGEWMDKVTDVLVKRAKTQLAKK